VGFDPPDDDDPFEDPFAGDPFEDPFSEDSFSGHASDPDRNADIEAALEQSSPETLRAFLVVAVLVHAGVFATSVGAMLIGFRGQWTVGGTLVVGGLFAIGLAVVRYRWYRRE